MVGSRFTAMKAASTGPSNLVDGFDGGNAGKLVALRMHGVDLAGEAQLTRALDGNGAFIAADEGDGGGVEEAGERFHRPLPPAGEEGAHLRSKWGGEG